MLLLHHRNLRTFWQLKIDSPSNGKAEFLRAAMIKPGAVVFDVGLSRINNRLVGDVHSDVIEVAAAMTPVPGGVGPMTRAMLLSNVVSLAE